MVWGQPRNPFGGDLVPPYVPPAQVAAPIAMPPVAPMAAAVAAKPKKTPVWKDILGAVLDLVGTAAGGHPTYFPMKLKLREKLEDDEREEKKLNRPILRDVGDDLVEYDPVTHAASVRYHGQPKNDDLTRYLDAAGITDPVERANFYRRKAEAMTAPPMQTVQGFDEEGNPVLRFLPRSPVTPQEHAAPTSKEAYDALPPGAPYVAPDGTTRVKGGAGPQAPRPFPSYP